MYYPKFQGPIEGWAVKYASSQFWRVQSSMQWEDLMQESYMVFRRCADKYPALDTPQHFMALFKRAWINEINTMAVTDSRLRDFQPLTVERDEEEISTEPVGELTHDGDLALLLQSAPSEVISLLNLMLRAPQEIIEIVLGAWHEDARRKASDRARLNRLLGLPASADVVAMTKRHFGA